VSINLNMLPKVHRPNGIIILLNLGSLKKVFQFTSSQAIPKIHVDIILRLALPYGLFTRVSLPKVLRAFYCFRVCYMTRLSYIFCCNNSINN